MFLIPAGYLAKINKIILTSYINYKCVFGIFIKADKVTKPGQPATGLELYKPASGFHSNSLTMQCERHFSKPYFNMTVMAETMVAPIFMEH